MARINAHRLLRYTDKKIFTPRVSKVRDGTLRVYWAPTQPASSGEPPIYVPPDGWPIKGDLVRAVRVLRMHVVTSTGPSSDTVCNTKTSVLRYPWGEIFDVTYCSCDEIVSFNFNGEKQVPPSEVEAVLRDGAPNGSSVSTSTGGTCSGNGDTNGAENAAKADQWIAAAQALQNERVKVHAAILPDYLWLSAASVSEDDVPENDTDIPFLAMRVLNVIVAIGDGDEIAGQYDSSDILSSDIGDRITRAYRVFPEYKTILIADNAGDVESEMRDIAEDLVSYGFSFKATSDVSELSTLVGDFLDV